jgi:hypothetical protein
MIRVVVMKCLTGLPVLIHIELLWRSWSRSFKNRGVGGGVGVGGFVYRLHSPGSEYFPSFFAMSVNCSHELCVPFKWKSHVFRPWKVGVHNSRVSDVRQILRNNAVHGLPLYHMKWQFIFLRMLVIWMVPELTERDGRKLLFLRKTWAVWFCAYSVQTTLPFQGCANEFHELHGGFRNISIRSSVYVPAECKRCRLTRILQMNNIFCSTKTIAFRPSAVYET